MGNTVENNAPRGLFFQFIPQRHMYPDLTSKHTEVTHIRVSGSELVNWPFTVIIPCSSYIFIVEAALTASTQKNQRKSRSRQNSPIHVYKRSVDPLRLEIMFRGLMCRFFVSNLDSLQLFIESLVLPSSVGEYHFQSTILPSLKRSDECHKEGMHIRLVFEKFL